MSHISLPHPPQSSLPPRPASASAPAARRGGMQALDYAFLQRCVVITPMLGAVLSAALFAVFHSVFIAASYFGGSVFGALMLATLAVFVRRFAALKTGASYAGWDAKIPVWAIAALKYVFFLVVAWGVAFCGWAQPFAFVLGIALMQLVIVARALGRKMTAGSIAEIYVDHAKR